MIPHTQATIKRPAQLGLRKKNVVGLENYPDITICPTPSFDAERIKKFGYHNLLEYSYGKMKNSPNNNLDGWAGFGNESVDIINKNISVVQSPVDCPIAKAYFGQDGLLEETLTFELTPSIHFSGACCKAKLSEFSRNSTIYGLLIVVKNIMNTKIERIKVYLSGIKKNIVYYLESF